MTGHTHNLSVFVTALCAIISVQFLFMLCIIWLKYIKHWMYISTWSNLVVSSESPESRLRPSNYVWNSAKLFAYELLFIMRHIFITEGRFAQSDQTKYIYRALFVQSAQGFCSVCVLLTQSNGLTFIQPHVLNLFSFEMHNVRGPRLKPDITGCVCVCVSSRRDRKAMSALALKHSSMTDVLRGGSMLL